MYIKNNQFLKYLGKRLPQIKRDIKLLSKLITLVEGEFENENTNIEKILDNLYGMLNVRQFDCEEVKELIEKIRNEIKEEKLWKHS